MISEEQERDLVVNRPRQDNAIDEQTETLNSVECPVHQHQNDNDSNLDIAVDHRDLSHHSHHPLDNASDPNNALFPHHQQHLQPHRHDLNCNASSTDANHITGSDILQHPLLTHNTLNVIGQHQHQSPLHHPEQPHDHQYQHQQLQQQGHNHHTLSNQSQQQQHHQFSYHHDQHTSVDDDNEAIVEATTALQHDVSVIDVGGLHQHPHSSDIAPISEHHNHNHHINPSRLLHQEHDHQLTLGVVYPPHQFTQHYQQQPQQPQQQQQLQEREQEQQTPSVDETQTSTGMIIPIFPPRNSPLLLPTRPRARKASNAASVKNMKANTRNRSKDGVINPSKITEKKRLLKYQGSLGHDGKGSLGMISVKKPRRRRYDNNFKAEVLNHLKGPHTKLSDVAKRYGIPENTLREWTKVDVVRAIETARSKNSGQLKANMYDPMKRLTDTLMVFFEHNRRQPEHLRQSITTKLIVAKGLEARNTLLQRHSTHPFLEPKERKALENFSGSDSWAKKFAKRRDLKMTGSRIKELSEEDVNQFHHSLKQISNRVKQAGPGYEDAAMLIRQAAEKLLLASIINSTASHRLMGNIAVSNSRNNRKVVHGCRSKS